MDYSSVTKAEIKSIYSYYYNKKISFPAAEIDAVVGFFIKRGFSGLSAKSTSIVLLTQARIDGVPVFKLIDTLTGLTNLQLSKVITEILNANRDRTSVLGYKAPPVEESYDSRNIVP